MASLETRLLVLGAVAIFEPVNGYQIRRELVTWGVEDWAHIRPGSIYSALSTLAGRGDLRRHDVRDGDRDVAVYTTTTQGTAELGRLFGQALREVRRLDPVPLHTAVALFPLFTRAVVEDHLAARLEALTKVIAQQTQLRDFAHGQHSPPQVGPMLDHQLALLGTELDFVGTLLNGVRDGALDLADEPASWRPADDDPGWVMDRDRERYRALLVEDSKQ